MIGLLALGWLVSLAAYSSWAKSRKVVLYGETWTVPPREKQANLAIGMLFVCACCTLWAVTELINPYVYMPGDCERENRTATWTCLAPVNKTWLNPAGVNEHTVCEMQRLPTGPRWVCGAR